MKGFLRSVKKRFLEPDPFLLPVTLVIVLFILAAFDIYQKGEIILRSTLISPFPNYHSLNYPFLKNKINPDISAKAAVVIDKD